MAADIVAWLASVRDYAAGVALYQVHGRNQVYQGLFAAGATSYSRGLLVQELQKLVATPVPAPPPAPVAVVPVVTQQAPPPAPEPVPTPADSPALQQVRRQLRQARDERSQLHAQLEASGMRVPARCKLAHRICDLTDHIIDLEDAERHVLEHGRLPGPVPLTDLTDREALITRRNNLRSQRSRLKNKPDRAADLAQVVADLALIEQKLNPAS